MHEEILQIRNMKPEIIPPDVVALVLSYDERPYCAGRCLEGLYIPDLVKTSLGRKNREQARIGAGRLP